MRKRSNEGDLGGGDGTALGLDCGGGYTDLYSSNCTYTRLDVRVCVHTPTLGTDPSTAKHPAPGKSPSRKVPHWTVPQGKAILC